MASVFVAASPSFVVDYSIVDGRVQRFAVIDTPEDVTLYDEVTGVDVPGWRARLVELVRAHRMDVDAGEGCPAFVERLLREQEEQGKMVTQTEPHK